MRWGLLAFVAVLLAACGPTEGRVMDKGHDAQLVYFTTGCIPQPKGGCILYPQTQVIPECWRLMIQDPADHSHISAACVNAELWSKTNAGDYWRKT